MPMYDLTKYSDNYSKTSGILWQYYKDESNNNLAESESFKSTPANDNVKDAEIIVPLKYLSYFRNF